MVIYLNYSLSIASKMINMSFKSTFELTFYR